VLKVVRTTECSGFSAIASYFCDRDALTEINFIRREKGEADGEKNAGAFAVQQKTRAFSTLENA
jgi:hypothetical protein